MSMSDILPLLSKVKRFGKTYRFPCPIHQGKDNNMVMSERDGVIGIHCFVCNANGVDLCRHLGLHAKVLFPEDSWTLPNVSRETPDEYIEQYFFSRMWVSIAENTDHKLWKPLTLDEKRKLRKHKARIINLTKKLSEKFGMTFTDVC